MKYSHIRQHDEKDCGAACLSMVCEYYGLKLPISKFRELIKVDNLGVNIYGIVTGAEKIGLHAEALEGSTEDLMSGVENNEITFPFIARIINEEYYEHFIVVYAIKKGMVYIGDPAKLQITKISLEVFLNQWQNQIITFSKTESFSCANERKGSFKKFFSLITKQKKVLISVFLVSIVISAISLFSASIFEYVIDDAIKMGDVDKNFVFEDSEHDHEHGEETNIDNSATLFDKIESTFSIIFQNLNTVCISIILLYLIKAILQALRGYMLAIMAKNVDIPLSLGYYNHLVDLPAGFFGTRKTGELLSRFSDASNIRDAISTATLTIMLDTVMAIVTGIYLCIINSKLFIITIIIMAIYTAILVCFKKPIKIVNQDIMEGNAQITSYLKESVDGIETVKAYKYEEPSKNKTKNLFTKFACKVVRGSVIYNMQDVLVGLTESVGLVVLLWVGAYLCIDNIITIGTLITFYYLLSYFLDPVKNLVELQPTMQIAIVAAERLNDILDLEVEDNTKNEISDFIGDIEFKNVDFRYGNRNLVLKNFNLHISKGSRIAFIGESGCGKTTIAKLLMNFYSPEKGTITINGKSIANFSPKSIRDHVAYISQEVFLFSDTIYNNLRMGKDTITDKDIENVCELCSADQFIRSLPFEYNTIIEENGNNLSGGQKQRLAIARALLQNPDILIMDEATSHLDTVTEESIRKTIDTLSEKMTVIIIAHRLNSIRKCNNIYVIDEGKIIEHGSHEELINSNGKYAEYCKKNQI